MALKRSSSVTGIKWETLKDRTLLVTPKSVETGIKTSFGEATAVKADVVVLDGPGAPTVYADTLIFPKLLQANLAEALKDKNGQVLARLIQGVAKPGQSRPWLFEDAMDDEAAVELATPYILDDGEEDELPY